jgi:DNA-binding response OmpR family regulator
MRSVDQAILLVENDEPTRELYQRALSRDYQVVCCSDAHAALDLLRQANIRAIILEPGLSGGDGWTLLHSLQQHPETRAIPVVLCSTLDERKRGMSLGAAAYLVKPVLPLTLLETLHRLILQA